MKEAREPTEYERFVWAMRRILSVPKAEVDKARRAWSRRRRSKRRPR